MRKNNRVKPRHRTYEQAVGRAKVRRKGGVYWFIGGMARKKDGNITEAVYRADSQEHAQVLAYQHFEEGYEIFAMPTSDMGAANQHYRTIQAESNGILLGDTMNRKRHSGKDLDL